MSRALDQTVPEGRPTVAAGHGRPQGARPAGSPDQVNGGGWVPPPAAELLAPTGPARPQRFLTAPEGGLRSFRTEASAWVWFAGCHGGAGETTLAGLLPGSGATGHRWPEHTDGSTPAVVLVARTSATGLLAARTAATQWAAGGAPAVHLLGLVLMADAPGRLPRPLRDLAERVAGGVPRCWLLPWVEQWRTGDTAGPRPTAGLFADLATLTEF